LTTAFLEPQLDRAVRWSAMRPLVARPESWPACPSIPFSGGQGAEGTDEHDPIDETGTPQSVVAFMLEQTGRTRADRATHGWPRPCLRVLRRQAAAFDRADPQAIIDLDARAVERSTPDEPRPEILVDQLDWLPAGASEPLVVDLPTYFRSVLDE